MTAAALSEEDEEERSGADKNTQADFLFLFLCVTAKCSPRPFEWRGYLMKARSRRF